MGKKLKALAVSVKESAQQIWLAGLGAFARAQEEAGSQACRAQAGFARPWVMRQRDAGRSGFARLVSAGQD